MAEHAVPQGAPYARAVGDARAAEARISAWGYWTPALAVVATFVLFALQLDIVLTLRLLALLATAFATAAAFVRMLAHGGSAALDGIGKGLALVAAVLALGAAVALLLLPV